MISNAVGLTGLEYLAVVTFEVQVSFVWFFGGGGSTVLRVVCRWSFS